MKKIGSMLIVLSMLFMESCSTLTVSQTPANCTGSVIWAHAPDSFTVLNGVRAGLNMLPLVANAVPGCAAVTTTFADVQKVAQAASVFLQGNPGCALQDLSSKVTGIEVLGINALYSLIDPKLPLTPCDTAILLGYLNLGTPLPAIPGA